MQFIGKDLWFPEVDEADDDGLLGVGGDLAPERLLLAYSKGVFPWFIESGLVFWYCPSERFIIYPEEIIISHSMKQVIKKGLFSITENKGFHQVIRHCAETHQLTKGSTWISKDFVLSYTKLYEMGKARSVEVWKGDELIGGLYGVEVGRVFCGESMFSLKPNASKLALLHLCQSGRYNVIDCQVYSKHLESMGAKLINRDRFLQYLKEN